MSGPAVLLAVVSGLLINELGDWCPWLAHRLVRWSTVRRYRDNPDRAAERAEELAALIDSRPGKLFKLITAVGFALATAHTQATRALASRIPTYALFAFPTAAALVLWSTAVPTSAHLGRPWLVGLILVGYLIADRLTLSRGPWLLSPGGIPLVLGLYLLDPLGLLLARLLAGLTLLPRSRMSRGKQVYNSGLCAIEVGTAEALLQFSPPSQLDQPASWPHALAAVAAAETVSSALVALAVVLTIGHISFRQLPTLLMLGLLISAVDAAIGLSALILVNADVFTPLVLAGSCAVATATALRVRMHRPSTRQATH